MRILVHAPHPFFQERGTPIAVDILVRALGARADTRVDLLVYAEGEDRSYPNVTLHRIADWSWTHGVRPGFSAKKLLADWLLLWKAISLTRRQRYDVIHAGEEAAFIALLLGLVFRIPFVYDLDSSIAQQMVESRPVLAPLARLMNALEGLLIRRAVATAPVCNALGDLCRDRGARKVVTLHDISQLADPDAPRTGRLAQEVGSERLILLYAGNLEPYQGIDLLLEAFAEAARRTDAVDLVVIGGVAEDVARYTHKARALGIADRAHLIGPRPFTELDRYLADADILTAPRVRGVNTPMKVFPYLHSGRPVLVTDLPTHSQILPPEVACLAPPTVEGFADAIVRLATDASLRARLGREGRAFVERDHTFEAHCRRVDALYDYVAKQIDVPGDERTRREA
jgi:glycosyltransferase involved in cell wall biosynthesis